MSDGLSIRVVGALLLVAVAVGGEPGRDADPSHELVEDRLDQGQGGGLPVHLHPVVAEGTRGWHQLVGWFRLGPFPGAALDDRGRPYVDPRDFPLDDLAEGSDGGAVRWEWVEAHRLRNEPPWAPRDCFFVARTAFRVAAEGEYFVRFGGDDMGTAWFDGELVWRGIPRPKSFRPDEGLRAVALARGMHRADFLCENHGGTTGWSVGLAGNGDRDPAIEICKLREYEGKIAFVLDPFAEGLSKVHDGASIREELAARRERGEPVADLRLVFDQPEALLPALVELDPFLPFGSGTPKPVADGVPLPADIVLRLMEEPVCGRIWATRFVRDWAADTWEEQVFGLRWRRCLATLAGRTEGATIHCQIDPALDPAVAGALLHHLRVGGATLTTIEGIAGDAPPPGELSPVERPPVAARIDALAGAVAELEARCDAAIAAVAADGVLGHFAGDLRAWLDDRLHPFREVEGAPSVVAVARAEYLVRRAWFLTHVLARADLMCGEGLSFAKAGAALIHPWPLPLATDPGAIDRMAEFVAGDPAAAEQVGEVIDWMLDDRLAVVRGWLEQWGTDSMR